MFTSLLAALTLAAPPTYRTYHNARYGYRIDYPAGLVAPQPEAGNGDGRVFRSADGQTTLTVYASLKVDEDFGWTRDRAQSRVIWEEKRHATITLDQQLPAGYVLSGRARGHIFYEKTVLRENTFTTFCWEYPVARKAAMDGIIAHTSKTFQPSVAGGD